MNTQKRVAVLGKQQPMVVRRRICDALRDNGMEADILNMETRNAADWIDALRGYHAIISAGEKFPREVFEALAPTLQLLSRYGVGTDEIDKDAATACGVAVCNAAGSLSTAVAECALGLMLCLLRHLVVADAEVRAGDWSRFFESKTGHQLEGKTVGLIGFGDISKALSHMLRGFDCRILAYDVRFDPTAAAALGVEYADLDTLRRESDVISLHLPSTPQTNGMINKQFLSAMKPTAILINTARGALVVAEDLADALNNDVIAGAGMDVFSPEPPLADNPLLRAKNTVLLPHSGACTIESHHKAGMMAAANVIDFFTERGCRTVLNPDHLKHTGGSSHAG